AVGTLLDALEGLVYLGQQLALPVAGAQFQRPVGLARGAVRDVRLLQVLFLEMLKGAAGLPKYLRFPAEQLVPEVLQHDGVHERLVFRRPIVRRKQSRLFAHRLRPSYRSGREYMEMGMAPQVRLSRRAAGPMVRRTLAPDPRSRC